MFEGSKYRCVSISRTPISAKLDISENFRELPTNFLVLSDPFSRYLSRNPINRPFLGNRPFRLIEKYIQKILYFNFKTKSLVRRMCRRQALLGPASTVCYSVNQFFCFSRNCIFSLSQKKSGSKCPKKHLIYLRTKSEHSNAYQT